MRDLATWQRSMSEQPRVFWVKFPNRDEEPSRFYNCRGGAMLERAWWQMQGTRCIIVSAPMHSLELAQERWNAD